MEETIGIAATGTGFLATPTRIEHLAPINLRWARKPSGEKVLQAAYRWEQGSIGGIDWRELETVDLPA